MHNPGKAFRDLLRTEPYLFTGGVYSPLDAQIAERVGIKSIYLSGYSMALANGWPDMGFLTQTEVVRETARLPTKTRGARRPICRSLHRWRPARPIAGWSPSVRRRRDLLRCRRHRSHRLPAHRGHRSSIVSPELRATILLSGSVR